MLKIKKAVLSSILALFMYQSYSQIDTASYSPIDPTFQKILSAAFKDDRVSRYIFDHDYILLFDHDYIKGGGAAFIHQNKRFYNYATNFGAMEVSYPTVGEGMVNIFDIDRQKIFAFDMAVGLLASTDNADTLVVLEKLKVKMERANLSLYTTNAQSKKFVYEHSKQKFFRIKCELMYDGSKWIVDGVEVKDFPFKSILDKE